MWSLTFCFVCICWLCLVLDILLIHPTHLALASYFPHLPSYPEEKSFSNTNQLIQSLHSHLATPGPGTRTTCTTWCHRYHGDYSSQPVLKLLAWFCLFFPIEITVEALAYSPRLPLPPDKSRGFPVRPFCGMMCPLLLGTGTIKLSFHCPSFPDLLALLYLKFPTNTLHFKSVPDQ